MTKRRILLSALAFTLLAAAGMPARAASKPKITNGIVTSFDGTPIYYNLFQPVGASAAHQVPIVFQGPGWSMAGQTDATGLLGEVVEAGFGALTWDPRGFGYSGGEAHSDSQDFEVPDVQALMDYVATLDWVQKDGPGDPRMGMIGASYGGGIQLMVASADQRVDAIVPQIAWNNLPQALKPGGVIKLGWDLALYGVGIEGGTAPGLRSPAGPQTGALAFEIHQALIEGIALNDWSQPILDWFADKSTGRYINGGTSMGGRTVPGIHAPALFLQGVNDTLFPMNEAIANWHQVLANDVESKIIFFCGALLSGETAHAVNAAGTSCLSSDKDTEHTHARELTWLRRYLLDDETIETGPTIDYQIQDGAFGSIDAMPTMTVSGSGSGTVANAVAPTSGVVTAPQTSPDGVRVPVVEGPYTLLGIPRVTGTVAGTGPEASLFFKLLDVSGDNAIVIDDQAMSMRFFNLSSTPAAFSLDIAGVSWHLASGHQLVLEVSTTDNDHSSSRTPAVVDFTATVVVPVVG